MAVHRGGGMKSFSSSAAGRRVITQRPTRMSAAKEERDATKKKEGARFYVPVHTVKFTVREKCIQLFTSTVQYATPNIILLSSRTTKPCKKRAAPFASVQCVILAMIG